MNLQLPTLGSMAAMRASMTVPSPCWLMFLAIALSAAADASCTSLQGLTLVHFAAQLERFAWDRGCARGLRRPY